MNVIGYIRVSTQGQARDGYSLAYQEDEIKVYCQTHQDGKTMILVDKDIHREFTYAGGVSIVNGK